MRRGLLAVAVLVLLALSAGVAVWRVLSRSGLPARAGSFRLPGISAPVTVRWNDWGVPHVTAERLTDLAETLGWLHANDRFTQMELGRRLASGRLAALVGEAALPSDRYFVGLGFRRIAAEYEGAVGPESRALLEAYARGVNAWLREREGDLPPELRILGADPEAWVPRDSLYLQLQMAHELSFWQGRPEEARFAWLGALGPERLRDLMGDPGLHVPEAVAALAGEAARARAAVGAASETGAAATGAPGSNNWALGPSRTATGTPIVANDPHLPLGQPGVWYQVQFRSPEYEAAGMTLPGMPFVVLGQGPRIAWAFTNLMLDDHDLFLEEIGDDGTTVRRGDGWGPVRETHETLDRGDGTAETVTLRWTDRGLLLDAEPELGLPARSMAWTGAVAADAASVFLRFARAASVQDLLGTLDALVAPAQNLVAGDAGGSILHQPVGRVPARRRGDGRLPAPGADASYGWDGLLPQQSNPLRLDPGDGILVTANHDVRVRETEPTPMTADFDTSHRADRIRQILERRRDWTLADMAAVQADVRSLYALEVVSLTDRPGDLSGDAARAVSALRGWDGEMTGSGPAVLFAIFEREVVRALFADEAEHYRLPPVGGRRELVRALRGDLDPAWFDDLATDLVEDRRTVVAGALERAWREVGARFGEALERWDYPSLDLLTFDHPLGSLPVLGRRWSRGPIPMRGSATTVAAFGGRWRGDALDVVYGPSMRWVADPTDPDATLMTLPTGQSGHPWDPHYDDQLEGYLEGRLRPAHWSERAIEANTVSRSTFLPGPPS